MWQPFSRQCFAMKWEINWSHTIPKEFWWNSGVSFLKNPWKLDLFISVPCASVESQWPSMEHLDFIPPSQGRLLAPSCQCSTPNVRQREVSPWAQLWCMCCLVTNKLLKTSQAKSANIVGFYRTFALETRNSTNSVTNSDKWWEKTWEINAYHCILSHLKSYIIISHKIPTHHYKAEKLWSTSHALWSQKVISSTYNKIRIILVQYISSVVHPGPGLPLNQASNHLDSRKTANPMPRKPRLNSNRKLRSPRSNHGLIPYLAEFRDFMKFHDWK